MSENYTAIEKEKLVEFRQLVSDILITENQKDDSFLIRWLRARNLDLKKAEEMLRKDLEWRKENKVDGILDREDAAEDIQRESPIAWCLPTSGGYPVLLCPMGRHDTRKFLEKYGKETCTRYNIIFMEKISKRLEMESEKHGRKITQIIQLIDLEGYSYRQISSKLCRDFMIDMQKTFDAHYPELLKSAIIINAPKIFSLLFHLLKPFIPKNTLDKLVIHGPNKEHWKKVVAELCPVERIPPHWGGTLKGKDDFCSGNEIWIQGYKNLNAFMNGLDENDAEYSVAIIHAKDQLTKEFDISEKGMVLEWKFKTESNDIGFQVSFCNLGAEEEKDVTNDVIPYIRVDCHNSVQQGSHVCETAGKYFFKFDNTFSYIKSKTLLYKISVIHPDIPEPEFEECPEF